MSPMHLVGLLGELDVEAETRGPEGAGSSQAGAVRLGVARALLSFVDADKAELLRIGACGGCVCVCGGGGVCVRVRVRHVCVFVCVHARDSDLVELLRIGAWVCGCVCVCGGGVCVRVRVRHVCVCLCVCMREIPTWPSKCVCGVRVCGVRACVRVCRHGAPCFVFSECMRTIVC